MTTILHDDKIFREYINSVYADVSGYDSDAESRKDNLVYGETHWSGINKIIKILDITEQDVFYDFGSGTGKIPMQFFINTPVKTSIGVELSRGRHLDALRMARIVKQEIPDLFWDKQRNIRFINDSFFDIDLSKATIVYACSTCFSDVMLSKIGALINRNKQVRYVISLWPIDNLRMPLLRELKISCSWDSKTDCYIYSADA